MVRIIYADKILYKEWITFYIFFNKCIHDNHAQIIWNLFLDPNYPGKSNIITMLHSQLV